MRRILFFLVVLPVLLNRPAAAVQSSFEHPASTEDVTITVELAKPFLDDGFGDLGFATSILRARALIPIGDGASLLLGTGLTHATLEGASSAQTMANPVVGVAFGAPEGTHGHVSVHLPLAEEFGDDDFSTGVALFSLYEHWEEFLPDVLSIDGGITPQWSVGRGGVVGVRGGASVLIPTGDIGDEDNELLVRSAVFGRFPAGRTSLGVELAGMAIVSESDLDFGQKTLFGVTGTVGLPGRVAPELFVNVPLDEGARSNLDLLIGFRVTL